MEVDDDQGDSDKEVHLNGTIKSPFSRTGNSSSSSLSVAADPTESLLSSDTEEEDDINHEEHDLLEAIKARQQNFSGQPNHYNHDSASDSDNDESVSNEEQADVGVKAPAVELPELEDEFLALSPPVLTSVGVPAGDELAVKDLCSTDGNTGGVDLVKEVESALVAVTLVAVSTPRPEDRLAFIVYNNLLKNCQQLFICKHLVLVLRSRGRFFLLVVHVA